MVHERILVYPSLSGDDVQRYESTDIYSALISSNAGVLVSELIFLSSPNPTSFTVECLAGGILTSENISVLASSTPPINMNYSMNMDTLIVTVSWGHSQPNFIQRFEILLDGELRAETLGSHISIEIQLLECKTYMLHIVAVDVCNNTSITEALPICCIPESTTPTTAKPLVNCQPQLISSASDGYICQGCHVVFNCEATGTRSLSWSFNSEVIVVYTSNNGAGVQRYMSTDIYSALISNNAGVLVSELIFLSSPNPPSFTVECLAGGIPRSENISVLASSTPPINMSYSLNMDTLIVTVSWNHSQPNFIQRFEILLDGEVRAEALGSHITIEIQLPECKNYMLHIVAVDLCNNTSITEALPISCTPESTTSTTAEPLTTTNIMGQIMACAAPAEIKIIKNVSISTLFFVLLLLLCCGVSQIMGVLYLWEIKLLCFNENTRVSLRKKFAYLRNKCCCKNRESKPVAEEQLRSEKNTDSTIRS